MSAHEKFSDAIKTLSNARRAEAWAVFHEIDGMNRELLAACRAFLGGPEMPQAGEQGHVDFAGAVRMMRAAIAKAEGR